jgi:hypothetical protein
MVLGTLRVVYGPTYSLDQLSGEVLAGEVAGGDVLVERNRGLRALYRFGGNQDAGHRLTFLRL